MSLDREQNVFFCDAAGVSLETPADIEAFFDEVTRFWKAECGQQKVYVLVNYDGFTVNLAHNDAYLQRMQAASELMAVTVVRYGGNVVQRTAARGRAIKAHTAANLYKSREEALEVVAQLRNGEMPVAK